ncbi:MAG: hypothetical protein KDK44_03170 [Chlamydiia bacterium]|nr:hypothetical protein [Chlamydiia bacterium]MCP5508995.1 hypothetical protein [Chlamydiales bacterium]
MKFFTPECDIDDDLWEERSEAYDAYIDSIYTSLPWPVKVLAAGVDLHDGFFSKAIFSQQKRQLELEGVFGDLEMGYCLIHLIYIDCSASSLSDVFDGSRQEIIFDEVESLGDHRFAHRMRFDSGKDLDLEFSDLEIKIKSTDTMQRLVEKPCKLSII